MKSKYNVLFFFFLFLSSLQILKNEKKEVIFFEINRFNKKKSYKQKIKTIPLSLKAFFVSKKINFK